MLKKSAFVSAAAAGVMMIGAPAFAGGYDHTKEIEKHVDNDTHQVDVNNDNSVVNVGDVLSNNAVPVCHNNINALGVQVADVANGMGLNVPIANHKSPSEAEGSSNCTASVDSAEMED